MSLNDLVQETPPRNFKGSKKKPKIQGFFLEPFCKKDRPSEGFFFGPPYVNFIGRCAQMSEQPTLFQQNKKVNASWQYLFLLLETEPSVEPQVGWSDNSLEAN